MSVNVTSYHYDLSETGANTSETTLTPANVNTTTFGKVASLPVDGQIYAQPLVMTNVSVPGQGAEDLVFVATENDSVYAFNAEGASTTPVWKTSLLQNGETAIPQSVTGTTDITPVLGITGTPVIDQSTGTLYVVGSFKESGGTYQQRLYALDIATGASKLGGPVIIAGSVPGTGNGSTAGTLTFNPLLENQRPGLTLANGHVYVAFSSHGDNGNYHGWVFGYNASSLALDYLWCDTPNAAQGGIWMSGGGLAVDSSGDLYLTSGNGSFDANTGGPDYSMALVKLSPSLQVLDYFSPYNEASLSNSDLDYGCSNAVLLPTQSGTSAADEVLTAGKWGGVYLNNSDTGSMGEFTANGPNKDLGEASVGGNLHNTIAYWNGSVFVGGDDKPLKAFAVGNGSLGTTPSSQSAHQYGTAGPDGQGTSPTISSNGTSNGIVWALDNTGFNSSPAILYAFNANNLGQLLWSSNQAAGGRDTCGIAVKFTTPVVANGFVYVGGGSSLTLYGNIPPAPPPPPPPPPPPGAITGFAKFTLNAANGQGIDGSSTVDNNNGAAPTVSSDNNTLTLTTAAKNEASSAFYNTPLYFQNFTASFTYQEGGGTNPPADGITFTIENDSRGANALAGGGGDLGYATDSGHPATAISPSFAVELNVYKVSSTSVATNGANTVSTTTANTGSVNLASGDPVNVTLNYNAPAQTLTETLTDTVSSASFSTTYSNVNLSTVLGSRTAYVGFTAGTGGADALQAISNFSYFASPAPQVDLSSYFTNYGIALDGQSTINGGYDGGGSALSETFFGAAQTIAAPAPAQTFFFAPANQPNTITASGQTISLPSGTYGTISLIGSAVDGNQANQAITVNYAGGGSTTFTQGFSDWHSTQQNYPGEANAIAMGYKLSSTGAQLTSTNPYHVYEYTFGVNPALTVQSITLPNDSNVKVLAIDVNAAPAVTGLIPTIGPTGGGTSVTINGSGFTGATAVDFGAAPATTFTVNNDDSITAVAPAGTAGTVDVTVVTAAATSLANNSDLYTYAVSITSVAVNGNNATLAGVQRSMVDGIVYTFSQAVTLAATGALTLAVHAGQTGTAPALTWAAVNPDGNGASTQWMVSFSGTGTVGGSIGDGVYDITLNSSAVTVEGNAAAAVLSRSTDTFYRLFGDATGDGRVNNADYNQFLNTFNLKSGQTGYNAAFDASGAGSRINNADYNLFLNDFNVRFTGFVTTI